MNILNIIFLVISLFVFVSVASILSLDVLNKIKGKFFVFNDIAENLQISFQDPATPIMESMINFHNDMMATLLSIAGLVGGVLGAILLINSNSQYIKTHMMVRDTKELYFRSFTHDSLLEIIWTLYPTFILITIAVPSFALLYALEDYVEPDVTVKVIGHQWYWSYECGNYSQSEGTSFDSYMINTEDLELGQFRLLEVDNPLVLPVNTYIRLLITSSDVLHSWAVPSFGIKIDACPGRLTQASLFIKREGVFYGQCSEICGVNHAFMPIVVESVTKENFENWLESL